MTVREVSLTHVPADALDIGLGKDLVYCKQCGWLLSSQQRGDTARAGQPCPGSPGISLRGA